MLPNSDSKEFYSLSDFEEVFTNSDESLKEFYRKSEGLVLLRKWVATESEKLIGSLTIPATTVSMDDVRHRQGQLFIFTNLKLILDALAS